MTNTTMINTPTFVLNVRRRPGEVLRAEKADSVHLLTISRLAVFLIVLLGAPSAIAADIAAPFIAAPDTLTVIGRAPSATEIFYTNNTAPGLGAAIGDSLTGTYIFTDADGDAISAPGTTFGWHTRDKWNDVSYLEIAGATASTFTPTSAQYEKYLGFNILPATDPAITDPALADDKLTSWQAPEDTPILPPRADLAREYPTTSAAPKRWADADNTCANRNLRLATAAELQATFLLYTRANAIGENSAGDIHYVYGWELGSYWTSTEGTSADTALSVTLTGLGDTLESPKTAFYQFACHQM